MKKNLWSKIESRKLHTDLAPWACPSSGLKYRLEDIEKKFQTNQDTESYEHIPVFIVACFESIYRAKAQCLIDLGKPYLQNLKKIVPLTTLKFSLQDLLYIDSKGLKPSDVISHSLQFNNFQSSVKTVSQLLGFNFLTSLISFAANGTDYHINRMKGFMDKKNEIFRDIQSIYTLRHIYCHEFNAMIKIDAAILVRYLRHAVIFSEAVEYFLRHIIYIHKNKIPSLIPKNSKTEFTEAELQLTQLEELIVHSIDSVGLESGPIEERLSLEMRLWRTYRKKHAKQLSQFYLGPSDPHKEHYWSHMAELTYEKIYSLRKCYSEYLEIEKKLNQMENFS